MSDVTAAMWQTIWKHIDARVSELGVTWKRIEREGHVSQRTLYKMRDDGTALKSSAKRASLCRALGWTPDSIDRLLSGLPPMPAPPDPPVADADELAKLWATLFALAAEVKDISARVAAGLAGAVDRAGEEADRIDPPVPQSPEGAP